MLMPSIFGEDLFDDFMGYPAGRQAAANAYPQVKDMMKTDIRDVDGNYELDIDLPGFKKEDVKIQLKDGYLNIQATREEKKDEKDGKGKYVRRERYTGTCNRSFYIGKSIKHEDIHAKYDNGILHLTFPKEETKKEVEEKKFIAIDSVITMSGTTQTDIGYVSKLQIAHCICLNKCNPLFFTPLPCPGRGFFSYLYTFFRLCYT